MSDTGGKHYEKTLLFISAFILLLMIFPSTTLAVTQSEWELKRDTKVGEAATLYAIDTAEDGTRTLREIGSIPAGTYIDVRVSNMQRFALVSCFL